MPIQILSSRTSLSIEEMYSRIIATGGRIYSDALNPRWSDPICAEAEHRGQLWLWHLSGGRWYPQRPQGELVRKGPSLSPILGTYRY